MYTSIIRQCISIIFGQQYCHKAAELDAYVHGIDNVDVNDVNVDSDTEDLLAELQVGWRWRWRWRWCLMNECLLNFAFM